MRFFIPSAIGKASLHANAWQAARNLNPTTTPTTAGLVGTEPRH